ncbi:MAG: phosphoribosylaminoimidazolesuccinocarboxamide synthase [Candidatus Buchananbacteria bacterium RIFCSPHIGHO2_01_FULL_39_8]|uniref:Phosphoribosylaminoimidazole-succinocarboxamide synthase n=1 Tax=Candidatus Buchananbacteria bacterium RIFCSPHIGHO2_01_FULL_39_8 TaxID=1797533 RepID=A0A1G1Y1Z3_9BACT|nr:MAG: phosphoribosylaminoimidazolesuccinocarboxamide synthase [Candidatus Buchananbacteria bacterium RIFCSPHIGHO2_01_FULL_39_8]
MRKPKSEFIKRQIKRALKETNLLFGQRSQGKVCDVYDLGFVLVLVATDRQSAFDRVLCAIPFKGQALSQLSKWWFEQTADIVSNHLLAVVGPNALVVKKLRRIPVEVVVRGYNTGSTDTSVWTAYAQGVRDFCGNKLPDGMVKNQVFGQPIITPTTKEGKHDEQLPAAEIVASGILTRVQWDQIASTALQLFARGQELSLRGGLILVDTKYEFGYDEEGNLCLIDEIHTPDSSRFWIAKTYQERFSAGQEPNQVSKEFLRLWYKDHCDPYHDEVLPEAPEDLVIRMSLLYIDCYQRITGQQFVSDTGRDLEERIAANLKFFRPENLERLPETRVRVLLGSWSDLEQVRTPIRFFKALPQVTIQTDVRSCHRNPWEVVGLAEVFGDFDGVVCAGSKAFQLPGVLKAFLVAEDQASIPVFAVALRGRTEKATLAARLSIEEVPGQPLEMAGPDEAFFGPLGMFAALRSLVERRFTERTISYKSMEENIEV